MAEQITADYLRERMENRFAYLHYNDQWHWSFRRVAFVFLRLCKIVIPTKAGI